MQRIPATNGALLQTKSQCTWLETGVTGQGKSSKDGVSGRTLERFGDWYFRRWRNSTIWRPEPEYNAVCFSGTHAGVAVNAKWQGAACNEPTSDTLEDWLTETQVNTDLATVQIADSGRSQNCHYDHG